MPTFSVPAMSIVRPAVMVDGIEVAPGFAIEVPGFAFEVPAVPTATLHELQSDIDAIRELLTADPWGTMPEMDDDIRWA